MEGRQAQALGHVGGVRARAAHRQVIRLESYEDALNNLTFDEESGQKARELFGDEYLLRSMLTWEGKKSETFLDVGKLQSPFSYKLRLHRDGEAREPPVDLPETFAYLIGLDVATRRVSHDGDRRYLVYRGTTRDGRYLAGDEGLETGRLRTRRRIRGGAKDGRGCGRGLRQRGFHHPRRALAGWPLQSAAVWTGGVTMPLRIDFSREALEAFCRRWRIQELSIFGSALREDFRPGSDVDVLVVFEPGATWSFRDWLQMIRELEAIFGRKVDLVERRLVEQSKNYIRRKHILSHLERVYVAR